MADERWLARRKELFGDDIIEQSDEESVDEFIGRIRELETGSDPHHEKRRTLIEEATFAVGNPTLELDFRDSQDAALWNMRHSLGLTPMIRRLISGRNGI
jgi:hypothetical protein